MNSGGIAKRAMRESDAIGARGPALDRRMGRVFGRCLEPLHGTPLAELPKASSASA